MTINEIMQLVYDLRHTEGPGQPLKSIRVSPVKYHYLLTEIKERQLYFEGRLFGVAVVEDKYLPDNINVREYTDGSIWVYNEETGIKFKVK